MCASMGVEGGRREREESEGGKVYYRERDREERTLERATMARGESEQRVEG